ncbi:hypothetical protein [Tsuneonella amylolytica]|uniref:hypothetical protein n=1 Tax=Tsuneonella amylolytica TaxID=2338327 RepID=UPI000EA840F0|nr:hypothetical protein [Tsuneonella amylolytica]
MTGLYLDRPALPLSARLAAPVAWTGMAAAALIGAVVSALLGDTAIAGGFLQAAVIASATRLLIAMLAPRAARRVELCALACMAALTCLMATNLALAATAPAACAHVPGASAFAQ